MLSLFFRENTIEFLFVCLEDLEHYRRLTLLLEAGALGKMAGSRYGIANGKFMS